MVEAFSLLAVGTSLIGTLLSFSEFFKEQFTKLSFDFPSAQLVEVIAYRKTLPILGDGSKT